MSNLTEALIAAKLVGGSGGGSGLPPIESSTTTILAEQSLAFEDQGGTWESVVADVTTPLVVGANYTVDWDGTSYDCVAFNLHGLYAVGNAVIAGETDTGEPFLVYVIEETGLIIDANDTSATHTFGLAQKTQDPANGTALSVQGNAWVASGSVLPPIINIMAEIVPSGTLSFLPSNDLYKSIVSFTPVNGSSYVVAWDDTDYEVTARYDEDYGVFVGNLSIVDETTDTGEPFVIAGHNGTFYIVTKNSAATHVVAISGYTQSPPDGYVLMVVDGEWKAAPLQ